MRWIRVAAAALNQTPLDWAGNEARLVAVIAEARAAGIDVLVTPELSITAYGCEDAFFGWDVCERAEQALQRLRAHSHDMVICVGLPVRFNGALFNTVCVLADGDVKGCVAKQNLAGDGIHYEPRWFKAWPTDERVKIDLAGCTVPMGDILFELEFVDEKARPFSLRVGFEICEDAWVPKRNGNQFARWPVDLILNPSASHFGFGKQRVRRRLVSEGSRAQSATYVYVNPIGNESGRAIYDGGCLIASRGEVIAEAPRFSFQPWTLTIADVDVEATRQERGRIFSFNPDVQEPLGLVKSRTNITLKALPYAPERKMPVSTAAWEKGEYIKEEEFSRAVALGLFDYLRKSRSKGFVVSLSGGADSAAVAILVHLAVDLARQELGEAGMRERLGRPEVLESTEYNLLDFLICVYQSTDNSSSTTAQAAELLATALGADFAHINVQSLVNDYTALAEKVLGQTLNWREHDLALQNIQARARAPSIWMVANVREALLLCTSNRSEAAVGYATMDGDTAGGLSPIAGIDKAFLRHWLRWMETIAPEGVDALPALRAINTQEPTAELRPHAEKQTDEGDLMPYDVLDKLERHAIRDKRTPHACVELLLVDFEKNAYGRSCVSDWVILFFRLWSRNQWKRERYAPSFHLDDENLDPKTWCRFPILSGGFEVELQELEETMTAREPGPKK